MSKAELYFTIRTFRFISLKLKLNLKGFNCNGCHFFVDGWLKSDVCHLNGQFSIWFRELTGRQSGVFTVGTGKISNTPEGGHSHSRDFSLFRYRLIKFPLNATHAGFRSFSRINFVFVSPHHLDCADIMPRRVIDPVRFRRGDTYWVYKAESRQRVVETRFSGKVVYAFSLAHTSHLHCLHNRLDAHTRTLAKNAGSGRESFQSQSKTPTLMCFCCFVFFRLRTAHTSSSVCCVFSLQDSASG